MIDDLVKYCVSEVAYDGELGCTIDRLKELIVRFSDLQKAKLSSFPNRGIHLKSSTRESTEEDVNAKKKPKQNVDDAYCSYAWSVIVKHPSIVVGTVPPGAPPVWIAPQNKGKKGQAPPPPPVSLDEIIDAKNRSMNELREAYGDTLRIAADKKTCFLTLTGTHHRTPKFSDPVYTVLQIISRAREKGVRTRDLIPLTSYEAKSLFYHISILVDMNLIVKIVAKGPSSLNWVVLKQIADRTPVWQGIINGDTGHQYLTEENGDQDAENETSANAHHAVDAEISSNFALIRTKVLKLLFNSTNYSHQAKDLILAAGYPNPTSKQRRLFNNKLHMMVDDDLIEKVAVPAGKNRTILCYRLKDKGLKILESMEAHSNEAREEVAIDENLMRANIDDVVCENTGQPRTHATLVNLTHNAPEESRPLFDVCLSAQFVSVLERSPQGMTIRELSEALGGVDNRSIDQILTRLISRVPPRHLAHLHVTSVLEHEGRVRRQRYFTLKHYLKFMKDQGLSDERYDWVHFNDVGNFCPADSSMFWETSEDWQKYMHSLQKPGRRNRPKEYVDNGVLKTKTTKKVWKNEVIDGVVKRGRPRKTWVAQRDAVTVRQGAEASSVTSEVGTPAPDTMLPKAKAKAPRKRKADEAGIISGLQENGSDETEIVSTLVDGHPTSPAQSAVNPSRGTVAPRKIRQRKSNLNSQSLSTPSNSKQNGIMEVDMPEHEPSILAATHPAVSPVSDGTIEKGATQSTEHLENSETLPPKKRRKLATDTPEVSDDESSKSEFEQLPTPTSSGDEAEEKEESEDGAEQDQPLKPVVKAAAKPWRRPVARRPNATNLSGLKRQQELMEVLKENGGVLHNHVGLALLLRDYVQSRVEEGHLTGQVAGVLSDKKTITNTVTALEDKGLVKTLKTVVMDANRRQMHMTVIYLPDVPQATVEEYIAEQQKHEDQAPPRTLSRPIMGDQEGYTSRKRRKSPKSGGPGPKVPREKRQKPILDLGARRPFLEDHQTVAQLFGFLLGKTRRAQELHLFTLRQILSGTPPPTVISAQQRIVSTDYWTQDYSLGSFCSVIPIHTYVPHLEDAQNDPAALGQPLKELDKRTQKDMKVKSSATKQRLLEMLVVLAGLQLITPLKKVHAGPIVVSDASSEDMPKRFEETVMPEGKQAELPEFWRFNKSAPIWILGLAAFSVQGIETLPPFHKKVSVADTDSALKYWILLQQASTSPTDHLLAFSTSTTDAPFAINHSLLASLCHARGWTAEYKLSRVQEEYLKTMVDLRDMTTPLSDASPERVAKAAYVACAPQYVVCNYFSNQATRLVSAYGRIEKRKALLAGTNAEAIHLQQKMVRKAQKHVQDLAEKWNALVDDVAAERSTGDAQEKLRPLRNRYMTVGGLVDEEKMRTLISVALRDPLKATKDRHRRVGDRPTAQDAVFVDGEDEIIQIHEDIRHPISVITSAQPEESTDLSGYPPLPPVINQRSRPLSEIIESMGSPEEDRAQSNLKRKTKAGDAVATRRKRFAWNAEYDDLLHDVVAVLRAHSRGRIRGIQWAPVNSIFPTVGSGSVRIHFNKYLALPGSKAYMERLEAAWYNLWQTHKGRPELPNPDTDKAKDLDLPKHVEFLRRYLDKRTVLAPADERRDNSPLLSRPDLPSQISDVYRHYRVRDEDHNDLDFYWGDAGYVNERLQTLATSAFTHGEKVEAPSRESLEISVAQAAVQIVIATEQEDYQEEVATALLKPFGEDQVQTATRKLLSRGTISKNPKGKPGRGFRISEASASGLTGMLPITFCEDAIAIETAFEEETDEWRLWSLAPNEGEMMALLRKVTTHDAEFKIQLPDLKMARDLTQWVSRKIQDEWLESRIEVLFPSKENASVEANEDDAGSDEDDSSVEPQVNETKEDDVEMTDNDSGQHGTNKEGNNASCLLADENAQLVDCSGCLEKAKSAVLERLSTREQKKLTAFLVRLSNAGKEGIQAEEIWSSKDSTLATQLVLESMPPLIFWSGYSSSVLISAHFIGHYSLWLSDWGPPEDGEREKPCPKLVMPRRWVDLHGRPMLGVWNSALRAIVGLLLTRPVANMPYIMGQFSKSYDRLDMLAVMKYLEDEGIIRRLEEREESHEIGQMTQQEEMDTYWGLEGGFDWKQLV